MSAIVPMDIGTTAEGSSREWQGVASAFVKTMADRGNSEIQGLWTRSGALPEHLQEGLNPKPGTGIQGERPVSLDAEKGKLDLAADNNILDLTVAERLVVMDKGVYSSYLYLLKDIIDPSKDIVRIGVAGVLIQKG